MDMSKSISKKSLSFAVAALLTVGGAGIAFAHGKDAAGGGEGDGKGGDRAAEHQARRAEMLAEYDANKDGKLDESERAKLHADRAERMFAKLDTNKDGVLSKAEFAAGAPMGRGRHGNHRGHEGERGDRSDGPKK
jgi:hypothetical protein